MAKCSECGFELSVCSRIAIICYALARRKGIHHNRAIRIFRPLVEERFRRRAWRGGCDLREKVARANQDAWDNWPEPIDHANLRDVRLAAADAAIAVCMEEAAPLVEQAFRHGIGYAQNVKVDDIDLAWETSRVRAALRALRGEGGVDDRA